MMGRHSDDGDWGNRVKGRCPACNLDGTLFVGSGGWITCGYIPCPNPTAIADMQEHGFQLAAPLPDDVQAVLDAAVAWWTTPFCTDLARNLDAAVDRYLANQSTTKATP